MAPKGLVLLSGALLSLAARADDPVVFRSDVSLVRVDAQVVDRGNRVITGLGPQDFLLREEGRPQPIQGVDNEKLPIDLVLLLDVSASMRPHVQRIASASREAMRQLREEDRVAIMVFDRSSRVRMGFRSSQSGVDRELENVLDYETFRGGTDITRGLLDAADMVRNEARREARRAIVIVTDDQTERERNVEAVESALTRADAVLMALIAPDAMGTGRMRRDRDGYPGGGYPGGGYPGGGGGPLGGIIFGSPRRYPGGGSMGSHTQSAGTEEIARASGGDSMPVNDAYALQDTLARIRQSYAVYFSVPPGVRAEDERRITLELADAAYRHYPGADVRYRHNYYAPVSTGPSMPGNSEPRVVTQNGSNSDDPDRPRLQRRPSVSPVPDGSREGPLNPDGASSPAPASAAPQAPPPQPAVAPPPPVRSDPNAPGWRKARPDELPPN
jgi:VWFA-related protein